MSDYGWQQPPLTPKFKCPHWGLLVAAVTMGMHSEGHEWVCSCGVVFVVVSNAGHDKRMVKRP